MAEDNSWWRGKGTPVARIVGNLWKDLRTWRTGCRHGGLITCQGRNLLLFFPVILRHALLILRMIMNSILISRWRTWVSRNPIWRPITIAMRFRLLCCMLEMMFSFGFRSVTGTGYWLVSRIVWYSLYFMIEFDTHDVLCLVSSIVWYSVCFMIEFDTQCVLCLVSSIVWYSVYFIYCVKVSFDTWYVLYNVSRLPFWKSL